MRSIDDLSAYEEAVLGDFEDDAVALMDKARSICAEEGAAERARRFISTASGTVLQSVLKYGLREFSGADGD